MKTGLYNWNYVERMDRDKIVGEESITNVKDGDIEVCKSIKDGESDVCKPVKEGEKKDDKVLAPLNDAWSPEKCKEVRVEVTPTLLPRRISFSGNRVSNEGVGTRIYVNGEDALNLECEKEKDSDVGGSKENIGDTAANVTIVEIEEDIKLNERNGIDPDLVFQEMKTLDVSGAIAYVERIQGNGDKKLERVLKRLEQDVRKEKEEAGILSKRILDLSEKDGKLRRSARIQSRHAKKS